MSVCRSPVNTARTVEGDPPIRQQLRLPMSERLITVNARCVSFVAQLTLVEKLAA
jgi:hypothetical protein